MKHRRHRFEHLEARALLAADVIISEILASNQQGLIDGLGQSSDWIELYHAGDEPLDLAGWSLTDDEQEPRKWIFPSVSLDPGEYLIVFASGDTYPGQRDAAGNLHATFRLSADGEYLGLFDAAGSVSHDFAPGFPAQTTDVSYGYAAVADRVPTIDIRSDRPGFIAEPTPGAHTRKVFGSVTSATVQLSQPSRTFVDSLTVELSSGDSRPGAAIYYTLDGSEPTVVSTIYTSPLELTTGAMVRARVIEPDAVPGSIASASYLRLSPEVAARNSQLPITILDNHGAGAVPNPGWNQTNAGIRQLPRQPVSLMILPPTTDSTLANASPQLVSRAGIRVRGAFSSSFPQPGYSVELWDQSHDDDTAQPVLGMEPAADWVLYSPNPQYDEALIDNTFMFDLQRQMGHWSPDYQYVELYLNRNDGEITADDYVGLYVWIERAERRPGRIDFPAFAPDGSSGGWILEINRMDSISEDGMPPKNFHTAGRDGVLRTPRDLSNSSGFGDDIPRQYNAYINFTHPNPASITEPQRLAIEGWFQTMEDVLWGRTEVPWNDPELGYAKYIDVGSFIDYLILNNLSHNGDGLLLSMWLYNPDPAGDGKLTFGPIWDVDLGSFSGSPTAELMRNADRLWYGRMFQDRDFAQRYIERWHELRKDVLSAENLTGLIESLYQKIGEDAVARDRVTGWRRRLDSMQRWVTQRADAIDRSNPPFPAFDPPPGDVSFGAQLRAAEASRTIYVTLDGTDPRLPGGEIAPHAVLVNATEGMTLTGDVTLTARTRVSNRWSPLTTHEYRILPPDANDLNQDGTLNFDDLALFCQGYQMADPSLDRDGDGQVTIEDFAAMVQAGWQTSLGDTDLNGVFDSTDLVQAFVYGRYESALPATWISGDRDCDGRFTSRDLIWAFRSGGYVAASQAAAVSPSALLHPRAADIAIALYADALYADALDADALHVDRRMRFATGQLVWPERVFEG
jgi:hypothetical protein